MANEKQIYLVDVNEKNYFLNVENLDDAVNFEIYKNDERQQEVAINLEDVLRLKDFLEDFIAQQKKPKKEKAKTGRKKIYEGETETLSIHVPKSKKKEIKVFVENLLKTYRV